MAKLRKVERKTKKLVSFFCRDAVTSRSNDRRVTKKGLEYKETCFFFCRDAVTSRSNDRRVTKKGLEYKETCFFFCRDVVTSRSNDRRVTKKGDMFPSNHDKGKRLNVFLVNFAIKTNDRQYEKTTFTICTLHSSVRVSG